PYPHAGVAAIRGGHITTQATNNTGRLKVDTIAAYDLVAEYGSHIEIYTPVEHQGNSLGFARSRCANIRLARNITIGPSGSAAPVLSAESGGQIRLDGIDGANLGDAVAGFSAALGQVTRAAALWVVGDSVCTFANFPADLSNIYRTN